MCSGCVKGSTLFSGRVFFLACDYGYVFSSQKECTRQGRRVPGSIVSLRRTLSLSSSFHTSVPLRNATLCPAFCYTTTQKSCEKKLRIFGAESHTQTSERRDSWDTHPNVTRELFSFDRACHTPQRVKVEVPCDPATFICQRGYDRTVKGGPGSREEEGGERRKIVPPRGRTSLEDKAASMNGPRTTSAELWSRDTDLVLRDLVLRSSEEINWNQIATAIEWDSGAVTPSECRERWDYVKETPVKGPWSSEEDDHLKRLVDEFGSKKWNLLARAFPGRSGKQCRERWHNHVDGRVKKGEWSAEEDQILCEAQRQLGNKWSEMSKILVGRSENAIKNRFNSLNAKGLAEMRANELMSKLAPEEKAALLNIDADPPAPPRPCSSSTANKKKAGANSTHVGKEKVSSSNGGDGGGGGSKSSSSKVKGGDVDGAGGRSKAGSGRKGSASKKRSSSSSSSGDSTGSDGSKSNGSKSNVSSSNVDGRDDRTCEGSNASSATGFGTSGGGNKSDDDATAASSGGGGGGDAGVGHSAAMEALMVAARDERTACGGSGDEGHFGGDPWNNSHGNRGGAEAGARWKRGWAAAGGEGAERRGRQETAGGSDCGAIAEPGRKAAKRPKGGQAHRKKDMARAEAGMSVLAQAAGLLDIEDSVEAADGNNNSSGGGGGGRGGCDAGRNGPDANVMLATDLVDCRSNFGGSGGGDGGVGGGGRYTGQYCSRLKTNGHNGAAFIDHGSTPPGSASPPPSGHASGGGGSAAGWASSYGGTGGGCGGRTVGTADAFPVGARGASSAGDATSIGRNSEYYHVGGKNSFGGESGGGERASWGGLPSSPSSSSSQRWSLHSVPGPWRPYLTGQDGGNGGGGGAAAAAADAARQDEGPDSG